MAGDPVSNPQAALYGLQQPEKLQTILAKEDCLSCRLLGATALAGFGGYSYWSGHQQLQQQRQKIIKSGSMFGIKSRQAGITGTSLILVGMGLYRLIN